MIYDSSVLLSLITLLPLIFISYISNSHSLFRPKTDQKTQNVQYVCDLLSIKTKQGLHCFLKRSSSLAQKEMNLIKFQRRYSFSFVTYEDFIYKDACETTFMLNDKDATAAFCLLPAHQAKQLFQLLFLLFILSALLLSDPPTTIKVTQHAILNKCLKIGNQVFLLDPYNPLILLLPASTTVSFSQGKDSEETVFIFTFAIKRAKEKDIFLSKTFNFHLSFVYPFSKSRVSSLLTNIKM